MKKKATILVGSTIVLVTILLTILGFSVKEEATPTPSANYSTVYINCDVCGTSDYATIEWKGYMTDCLGYTPDWVDEGTYYFDSNGQIAHQLIGPYQCGYLDVQIVITKVGADCTYYERKDEGYHYPPSCNTSLVNVTFDIEEAWDCPDR
jgi:hypothetical protein